MIHRIYSDLPRFKTLEFQAGLNLLLADKSPGATDRQTRNGAGKTSLVELIHFLMGANCDRESLCRVPALVNATFWGDLDIGGSQVTVGRSGQQPSRIIVAKGDTSQWPVNPTVERDTRQTVVSNNQWRDVLGKLIFGLRNEDASETSAKFGPTFRSLFSYFARRQESGAFSSPFKQAAMQQTWDHQVALSYLLRLDWRLSQQWQVVREREKSLKELRKAAADGAFGAVIGTTAQLRTRLAVSEEAVRRLTDEVATFRVLESYRELETEAGELTRQIAELSDQNTIDRQLVTELGQAVATESVPPLDDLQSLYGEAGVALPDATLRRFDEVRAFHESVIENRRSYLGDEITAAERRILQREEAVHRLASRRAQIMLTLQSHGALDHFSSLQGELTRRRAEVEAMRQKYEAAEQLEGSKTELEIQRNQLLLRLRQDFREQRDILDEAIVAFEEVSHALYEDAGSLKISESPNGPEFDVVIHGDRSKGISNMKVFCFDMMMMRLCVERGIGPGFLIHDSHLFDGVDERQVAKALQVGAEAAARLGFQYVVTMNSDALPRELPSGFNLDDYILPVLLTDATEDGGLFGVRFS